MNSAPIPNNFWQYIKSMGPGIIIALTWLGAGDLVDSAIAGGNYGYTLMWAMAIAIFIRFIFVSIIAKYQLCNQHNESLISGLKRLHPSLPIIIIIIALYVRLWCCSSLTIMCSLSTHSCRRCGKIMHKQLFRVAIPISGRCLSQYGFKQQLAETGCCQS